MRIMEDGHVGHSPTLTAIARPRVPSPPRPARHERADQNERHAHQVDSLDRVGVMLYAARRQAGESPHAHRREQRQPDPSAAERSRLAVKGRPYRFGPGSFDPFLVRARKISRRRADANDVSAMSSSARSADSRIAEALRLPVMERRTILNDLRSQRRSRKVGTAVTDRFRISLPWDDHVGLA